MEYSEIEIKNCPKCGSEDADISLTTQKGLFSKTLPVVLLICNACKFDCAICNLGD